MEMVVLNMMKNNLCKVPLNFFFANDFSQKLIKFAEESGKF